MNCSVPTALAGPHPTQDEMKIHVEINISRDTVAKAVREYLISRGVIKSEDIGQLIFFDDTQHCVILGGASLHLRLTKAY